MDRHAPVKVMLRNIKEIQMFLLEDRKEDCGLKQSQLILHALINLAVTGLYNKAIEHWNACNLRDCR